MKRVGKEPEALSSLLIRLQSDRPTMFNAAYQECLALGRAEPCLNEALWLWNGILTDIKVSIWPPSELIYEAIARRKPDCYFQAIGCYFRKEWAYIEIVVFKTRKYDWKERLHAANSFLSCFSGSELITASISGTATIESFHRVSSIRPSTCSKMLSLVNELIARTLTFQSWLDCATLRPQIIRRCSLPKILEGLPYQVHLPKRIETEHGHLDAVVAYSATYIWTALATPPSELRDHLEVNVIRMFCLFQPIYSLLKYGRSNIVVNYFARKIHFKNSCFICFLLAQNIVQSDMSRVNRVIDKISTLTPIRDAIAMSAEEAARPFASVVENGTREKNSAEFMNTDDQKLIW
ncbi:hypothetical protein ARMSODRAFT_983373 [Armillaria solidipes]|uniref:Uncharacterized protein n=1 Tax=Armillaria solidipes TaxID=1076256 RepID=A0A2H3AZ28_9AGAR|nr:hypothetical protein ARMSODRAFT_983373 [Armillaria solidipes]